MSPLIYGSKSLQPPNRCMECGETCRRPKRFCADSCKERYLAGRGFVPNYRGIEQVRVHRQALGITLDALEWRRKLNVQQSF
jgi:hypothetical protein